MIGSTSKEVCYSCRFSYGHLAASRACRRHPPVHQEGMSGEPFLTRVWPEVSVKDWCGDWEAGKYFDKEAER